MNRAFLFLLTLPAFCQSPIQVPDIKLPTYLAGGGAFNQLAGINLWASGILPVSSSIGLYESTTADLFPVKATVNGRSGYVFQTSIRQGIHKVVHDDGKNMALIGADGGYSFASSNASGASASIILTYVRHIGKSWAVMFPVRALYLPGVGGWNAIAEVGLCFKP